MSELLEQLQGTLAASYRVERELGGGMSRVFIAHDLRLDRKVVLKVLPPELAGDVNVERFEREIRLAARLQHPHIVPLLAAGSAGDLPYYVMPFIEGESLRARLARDGELPLGEAVRLLGEVIDALDYAHRHGVVHRDIKPDNILLTGHHAVVTDFGVAKAVTEATGGDLRLTATGVAIGTPAYMAPEQITAEVNVDHRADIYATGSLAFEMLTGLQPFRGATTQAVLAAHMTQPAPSLTTLRRGIPPELDALVLRCLEKRPADRWQSASEMIPALNAVAATTSGAISAPRSSNVSGLTTESGTAHPIRVASIFATVSVVVLAAVWGLVQFVGLPDWVFGAAIALLVVGLPIVLFASRRDRQRSIGDVATPVGLQRLLTLRRSVQGGVLAFTGLALAAAGFMASRAIGIGPGATLLSAGVLTPRDRIVLADFANRTADTTLGITVAQLLRIDLAQSPTISVMEPSQVSEVLARMQRERSTDVTPEIAREVATRENIKAYLTGEIIPAGKGFVIAARLVSVSSGDALVTLRRNVSSPDELMKGVDKLSSSLREAVGESLRSVRSDPPLEQVTTSSLAALRLYAEATRAADKFGYDQAIDLLEQAVAVDSNFAMAWRRLGTYATNAGQGPLVRAKGDSAIRRAYALRQVWPERERLFVEAAVAQNIDLDFERAGSRYLSVLEKYPQDVTALNNLGAIYDRLGRTREALEQFRKTIATGMAPALTYSNAIVLAADGGSPDLADSLLRQFERDFPESAELTTTRMAVADDAQDFRAVDSLARVMVRGAPLLRALGHQYLTTQAELGGRLADAARELRNMLSVDEARGQLSASESKLIADFADVARSMDYVTDSKAAARRLDVLWNENRTITAARRPLARRHRDFALVYARLGDTTRAQALIDELAGMVSERDYPAVGARFRGYLVRANIANAAGRPDDALALVREGCGVAGASFVACERMAFLEVAEAHDRAGRADSAIAAYRRFVNLRGLRYLGPPRSIDDVTPRIAPAWRRLGELLEAKGDQKGAIEAYERFLDFWRDADADLQPIVRTVRERVNRLRRASG
jgi:tetratricopeptide (TPR) repeat protein/tRNA A-37 threonylcarbamoyl transferase component Bud32